MNGPQCIPVLLNIRQVVFEVPDSSFSTNSRCLNYAKSNS